jgi:hypothetical protein
MQNPLFLSLLFNIVTASTLRDLTSRDICIYIRGISATSHLREKEEKKD